MISSRINKQNDYKKMPVTEMSYWHKTRSLVNETGFLLLDTIRVQPCITLHVLLVMDISIFFSTVSKNTICYSIHNGGISVQVRPWIIEIMVNYSLVSVMSHWTVIPSDVGKMLSISAYRKEKKVIHGSFGLNKHCKEFVEIHFMLDSCDYSVWFFPWSNVAAAQH